MMDEEVFVPVHDATYKTRETDYLKEKSISANTNVIIADDGYNFNSITQNMYEMSKKRQFCDTEIISCDGINLLAHSTVLASRCNLLKQCVLKSPTSKYKIKCEEISGDIMQYFLEYIYIGKIVIPISKITNLNEVAEVTETEELKRKCKEVINQQMRLGNMNLENKSDAETAIETDLMKFAAGLSDNFEFLSTVDEVEETTNSTQIEVLDHEGQLKGMGNLKVEDGQTPGSENGDYYMVQERTDEGPVLASADSTSTVASTEHTAVEDITAVAVASNSTTLANNEHLQMTDNIQYPAGINPNGRGRPRTCFSSSTVYKCGICLKKYTTKQSLERHLRLHQDVHPYTCELCGKSFKTDRYLKCHMMRHSKERSYQCPICGKSFKTPRDSNWHKKTVHTTTKPFHCTECSYSSKTRALLKQHLQCHTASKQYSCKTCGKTFLRKQHLEQHASRHEGKRQYMCSTCGSEFYTIYACKEHHMRVHQGIKKYECSVCHQQYNEKKSFMKHLQKHSLDLILKLDGSDVVIEQTVEESTSDVVTVIQPT